MVARLIETTEEDSFVVVAQFIGQLLDGGEAKQSEGETTPGTVFAQECQELYSSDRVTELLHKFVGKLDLLFECCSEDTGDLEGVLDILCHLVPRVAVASAPELPAVAAAVADALATRTDRATNVRLQALTVLSNVVESGPAQHAVLLRALRFAGAAGRGEALLPYITASADAWAAGLGLTVPQERELLLAAAEALLGVEGATKAITPSPAARSEGLRLLGSILDSYEGCPPKEVLQGLPVARRVVVDFVTAPDAFRFDAMASPAVAALGQTASTAQLYTLLSTLLVGGVHDVRAVAAQHPELLPSLGVGLPELETKVRLMGLAGLAAGADVLSFDDIIAAVAVEEGEVETLVVRAVGKGLLDARIDQLARTVTVSRAAPRAFGPADWAALADKLHAWTAALDTVEHTAEDKKALLQQGLTAIKA